MDHRPKATSLAALLAILIGCQTFDALEADGRCGNGIVEPAVGEDCDGFAPAGGACGEPATPRACRFACDAESGGACATGWACGQDGICRAPAGELSEPTVARIPGSDLLVGDLDGDGRQDVLVVSSTAVSIGYGDSEGRFESQLSVPVAVPDALAKVADLDGDGVTDLVLASVHGTHLFKGHPARRLQPLAVPLDTVPAFERPTLTLPVVAAATARPRDLLLATQPDDRVELAVHDRETDAAEVTALLGRGAALVDRLATGDIDGAGRTSDEVVLGRVGESAVHVVTVSCGDARAPCAVEPRATVPLDAGLELADSGTWLADVDGDGPLDIVAVVRVEGGFGLAAGRGAGDGTFEPLTLQPHLDDAAGCVRCSGALNTASGLRQVVDLDGDGVADYVNRAGLYVTRPGPPASLVRVLQPGRPWNFMDVADLNHDGLVDVVATRPGVVDVVLAAGAGRYNVLSAPTDGSPSQVAVGDFDGDLIEDIAIVEGLDTVSVLFSGRQGVATERVVMAELPAVARLAVTQSDEDAINDLVVTVPTPDGEDLLVQLRGDSSRRMASTIPRRAPVTVSVAAGRFSGGEQLDVMIAEPRGPTGMGGMGGGGAGMGPPKQFRLASMVGAFGASRLVEQDLPLAEGCTYPAGGVMLSTVADLDGDGVDSLLALQSWGPEFLDLSARPYGLRLFDVVEGTMRCAERTPIESAAAPVGIEVADLDGDGVRDVVVGLGLPTSNGGSAALPDDAAPGFAVYWGDPAAPGRLAAEPTLHTIERTGRGRLAFAVLEVNGRPGSEIAFADDTMLGFAAFDAARQLTTRRVGSAQSGARALRAVDADGDGLDDLVLATGNELLVYHQRPCDARRAELGGCTRPAP